MNSEPSQSPWSSPPSYTCANCGFSWNETARFCPRCGAAWKPSLQQIKSAREEFLEGVLLYGCGGGGCGFIFFGSVGACFALAGITSGPLRLAFAIAGVALLVGAVLSVLWALIIRRG